MLDALIVLTYSLRTATRCRQAASPTSWRGVYEMRNRIISGSVLAAAGLLCLATTAQAQEQRQYNNWEFTPFVGYMAGGEFEDPTDESDRNLDAATSYGLFVDAATDWWRHYEMLYARQSTKVD